MKLTQNWSIATSPELARMFEWSVITSQDYDTTMLWPQLTYGVPPVTPVDVGRRRGSGRKLKVAIGRFVAHTEVSLDARHQPYQMLIRPRLLLDRRNELARSLTGNAEGSADRGASRVRVAGGEKGKSGATRGWGAGGPVGRAAAFRRGAECLQRGGADTSLRARVLVTPLPRAEALLDTTQKVFAAEERLRYQVFPG